jgi:hypothetical protein
MAEDYFKPRGPLKSSKPDAGGAVLRQLPTLGIVKSNIDPQRGGKIFVYLPDLGTGDPDNSNNWTPVNYLSPFYGVTSPSGAETGWGEYIKNPNSYGVWNSPPDIGTTVICLFVDGKPDYGFYIGAIPPVEALHMVPAIGGSEDIVANAGEAAGLGGAKRLPVVNINTNNGGIADSSNYLNEAKPIHSYVASILAQQGLIRDPIRGVIGTTSQRETPSRVGYGVSTPGRPIYQGGFTDETLVTKLEGNTKGDAYGLKVIARRGGHSLVMDDGDILGKDQLVRIRTSMGHQILMSDDGQCLHIIHANGKSWIELGKEGTIDMYSSNSVNVRTQGDLNLHADNNININAGKALNISADTIAISSENETTQKVGTDFSLYASGKYTTKVEGRMSFASSGDASFYSDAITYFNGSKINLNTGSSSLVPEEVKPLSRVAHTDTLFDTTKGWLAAPGKLLSIVSRAPAHAPWSSANQGVDVKVNNNASEALPQAASPAVTAANNSAGAPTNPVSVAVASTVPTTGSVSKALTDNITGTIVAATATLAQKGEAAAAVKLGAGIVQTAQGAVAAVGATAQSPDQMEQCGIIKPGSAALINTLVQGGKTIQQACTPNLFTGKGGDNLQAYVNDPVAQVAATVRGLEIAQDSLIQKGIITGKEGPGIAGVVLSEATLGGDSTVNFIKNAASSTISTVSTSLAGVSDTANKAINIVTGNPASLISGGNFAGAMADKVTGGLSGIAGSVDGLKKTALGKIAGLIDSTRGVAAAAFGAITASIPTLKVGVPQNIKDITEKAIAAAQTPVSASGSNPLTGVLSSVTDAAKGVLATATGALGVVDKTLSAATGLIKTASITGTADLSTGLGLLPGGDKITASFNDLNKITSIPGVASITGLVNTVNVTAKAALSSNPLESSGVLNAATQASNAFKTGFDQLKNGNKKLTDLLSGLPAGASAQFQSAMDSITAGGAVPIKLPNIAVGTDLTASVLADATKKLLGDSRIPAPNFTGEISATAKTALEKITEAKKAKTAKIAELDEKLAQQKKLADDAIAEQQTAKNSLPAGDPSIEELRQKAMVEVDKQIAIQNEIVATLRA